MEVILGNFNDQPNSYEIHWDLKEFEECILNAYLAN